MSTTLTRLAVQRFTRTVSSGLATNTEWLGLMAANAAALDAAPWLESPSAAATLPVNDPTLSFAGATAYDAWKQSGDASTGTGRQCAYAGMAAYRVALPAPLTVQSVSVRLAADKFCVGGLSLVVVESDAATPEAAWNGSYTGADSVRQTGLLAETAEKVSASTNRSDTVTLDLSGVSGTHAAVWLLLALADYTAARREYWIEGSGCIDAESIEVVVAEDVPEQVPDNIASLLLVTGTFTGASTELASFSKTNIPSYQYILKMQYWPQTGIPLQRSDFPEILRLAAAGRGILASVTLCFVHPTTDSNTIGSFGLMDSATSYRLLLDAVPYYVPEGVDLRGASISVPNVGATVENEGSYRLALVQGDGLPADGSSTTVVAFDYVDWPAAVRGVGDALVGFVDVSENGDNVKASVSVPIQKVPTKPYLWLVAIPISSGLRQVVVNKTDNSSWEPPIRLSIVR